MPSIEGTGQSIFPLRDKGTSYKKGDIISGHEILKCHFTARTLAINMSRAFHMKMILADYNYVHTSNRVVLPNPLP